MSAIKILSPQLANQIAAGEVVERPASVLKELVENSLDAGAKRIDIEIEQGGVKLIKIRDDGHGIPEHELALALSRHATSKIDNLEDLEAVVTLGFRGEALASIASVSRLALTSNSGDSSGWKAVSEGRDMEVELKPAAHPQGTSVEVRDLFFNTPARRKFLRTEGTEYNRIDDSIKKLALSRMDVAFSLRHNQRAQLTLRPARSQAEQEKRVADICGPAFMKDALYVTMIAPVFGSGAGWVCRRFREVRLICSTSLSMVERFATRWYLMPCAKPIRMFCTMAVIPPLFCFSRLSPPTWMLMCIPPNMRCAFETVDLSMALSTARCIEHCLRIDRRIICRLLSLA